MPFLSPLRFSRYFFALFLTITVVPLLCLLLWSQYDLNRSHKAHDKEFFGMVSRDVTLMHRKLLEDTQADILRIVDGLGRHAVSAKEYRTLLNTDAVWQMDSDAARKFLERHPELRTLFHSRSSEVLADYVVDGGQLVIFCRAPVRQKKSSLLILKEVSLNKLAPPGPFSAEFFAGETIQPSHQLASLPPFSDRPKPRFDGNDKRKPPPPRAMRDEKPLVQQLVAIRNAAGQTVVTERISLMPPPGNPFHSPEMTNGGVGVLILLAGLLSSLLAGRYIQRNFISPLMRLSKVAGLVREGDLSLRVDLQGVRQAEVCRTLEDFNAMLDGLVEKEKLRHSFISNLTHDFRTPLIAEGRSLELLARELQEHHLFDEEKLASGILKNNAHLLTMVNHLLETYQTEADRLSLDWKPVRLPELVLQCFDQLGTLAEERQIGLSQEFLEGFPVIMADEHYLKRVLINLIANALENIPQGSRIEVLGRLISPDQVELRVRDNGPGIPELERDHLFERYYAGTGDTRKLGAGLGLYICKVLVAAHGGSITIESVASEMTDFVIRLPVTPGEIRRKEAKA